MSGIYIPNFEPSKEGYISAIYPDGTVVKPKSKEPFYEIYKALPVPDHGRLVALPFSVGTEIWSAEPFKDRKPRRAKVTVFEVDDDGAYGFWCSFNPEPMSAEFLVEDIGKTVFFSCEEAEKALEVDNGT